jgi:hypothetical protein
MRVEERQSYQQHILRLESDYEKKTLDLQQQIIFIEEREAKRWAAREAVF